MAWARTNEPAQSEPIRGTKHETDCISDAGDSRCPPDRVQQLHGQRGSTTKPPSELNFLMLAPTAPALCSNSVTFDATKGVDVEAALQFPGARRARRLLRGEPKTSSASASTREPARAARMARRSMTVT
jgi:hypothetical protein